MAPNPLQSNRNLLLFLLASSLLVVQFGSFISCGKQDFYSIFGLSRDSFTEEKLKSSYKSLSKKWHPDRNKDPGAEEMFQEIGYAYSVLSNPEKKRTYDLFGEEELKRQGDGGRTHSQNPFDIFEQFFGGGGPHAEQPKKRPATVVEIQIPLEIVFSGGEHVFEYERQITCPSCDGSGAHSRRDIAKCSSCSGSGFTVQVQILGPFMQQVRMPCAQCSGRGSVVSRLCSKCSGSKIISQRERKIVRIDPGVQTHATIVLEEAGSYGPDGHLPGDIILKVSESAHSLYRRAGPNLYLDRSISLEDSILGFATLVTGIDGNPVSLGRSSITPHGFVLEIPSAGLPKGKGILAKRGSLFVTFNVIFPPSLPDSSLEKIRREGLLRSSPPPLHEDL